MAETNFFQELYDVDVSKKIKKKDKLSYLPWSSAWAEVKKIHPNATYKVYEQNEKWLEDGTVMKTKPWFDDGKTAWVKVAVTIDNLTQEEILPVMDFRNNSIPCEKITSAEVNKSTKRCLVKAISVLTGLGLYIYEGEEIPEATKAKQAKAATELDEQNAKNFEICQQIYDISKKNGDESLKEKLQKKIKDTIGVANPKACKDLAKSKELYDLMNKMIKEIKEN